MDGTINLYPVGVIVNPYSYWLAATPDRKVYCPERNPLYGLLEIKCPVVDDINDAKCLQFRDGQLSLKKNDNYYYQIQLPLAVTGFEWSDFFVWTENDSHPETVYLMNISGKKQKINLTYFSLHII